MAEPEYRLEDGKYAFYLDDERLFETDEISILFDKYTGGVLKHGTPDRVIKDHATMRQAFIAGGSTSEADDLVCITGKFELEELNKVVTICDYAGRFYKKLQQFAAQAPANLDEDRM